MANITFTVQSLINTAVYNSYTVADTITITPTGGAAGEVYISGFDNLSPSFSSSDIIESLTVQTVNEFSKIIKNDNFRVVDYGLQYFFNASSDTSSDYISGTVGTGYEGNPNILSRFQVVTSTESILDRKSVV